MRIERFAIEKKYVRKEHKFGKYETVEKFVYDLIIYDRLKRKKIVEIDTDDPELDKELAEAILTMLNIKCVGEFDG